MTLDAVTDIFAFVLAEGQFTESILFAKDAPSELTPDERKAIDAVLGHVEQSYVALLGECRAAILALAASEDDATRKVLESNWNRDKTIWERGRVVLPVLIRESWNAWITIGLWPRVKEIKEPIGLHGHLGVMQRHAGLLAQAAGTRAGSNISPDGTTFWATPIQPKEGERFDHLGQRLAADIWPVARELRHLLVPAKPATATI